MLAAQRARTAQPSTPSTVHLPAAAAAAVAAAASTAQARAACLPGAPPAALYTARAASISEQPGYPVAMPLAAAVLDTALW